MKVETLSYDDVKTIQVFSYTKSDYNQLIALMSNMGDFYPWYYFEKDEHHVLVYYSGWIKDSDNAFDDNEWKYKINIKEMK